MPSNSTSQRMIAAAKALCSGATALDFSEHVSWVYNPLDYAWEAHQQYLRKYARSTCRVLFLGMNPGPWGMTQTGVPFGEVEAVKNWLHIAAPITKPTKEHPKRPIEGLDCVRSEVSGRRLWGLFAERFDSAKAFMSEHFVANYCPLVFMEESARNITPDKLPASLRQPLEAVCDQHLSQLISIMQPQWIIGIGAFAEKCALRVIAANATLNVQAGRILHPSPASPAANKDWSGT
ncbi:MAG: hypothetical protein KDA51_11310, partial [Planctomycetales bacterium]|nr:hypothetical protein [Planctomycetales bacterium]